MKKTLLFIAAVLVSISVLAQQKTTFVDEHFNGSSLPTGWQAMGLGTSCWSISSSQHAGGEANELKLYYSPQFNGTARMVTPAVDLTDVSSVVVSFKHCLDNYSGSHVLGIATTSDNGTTWNDGWSQTYGSDGQWSINQLITTPDMGNSSVRFCIFYTGNSYNIDNWYFDDIAIFTQENLDVQLSSIDISVAMSSGTKYLPFTISNKGVETVNQVKASYQVEGFDLVEETFNVNLTTFASTQLTFAQPITLVPGSYHVEVNIETVNGVEDDDLTNNILDKDISIALTSATKIPMIEHFSSSTCGPCVSVNTQMLNFCNNPQNQGRFTYTKYQMNWPGNGDPYYTAEGGTRRVYYGVSAVPQCFLDGDDQGNAAVQQSVFNNHLEREAFMDIRGSFDVSGNTITVRVDAMPYVDIEASLFVSVNEKETHNNVGGNGETSFHHVFMKMLTSAQGDSYNFESGEMATWQFTQDMSSTHVEEMSDLEVSIWVQVYSTHEILNSHFAYEYTSEHPYPVDNLTMVESTGKDKTFVASWDAPANGTPTGYDVYLNGEKVLENTTDTEYTFTAADDTYNVVCVQALYTGGNTSVMSAVGQPEGMQDLGLVPDETNFLLNSENPEANLALSNCNFLTEDPIEITSIEETNPEQIPYLNIISEELPFTLEFNEYFFITVEPGLVAGKSMAQTTVTVESSAGNVEFFIEIDGEILNVTELSAETKLYPNPTTGSFIVEGSDVAKVEVYSLVGQKVFEQSGKVARIDATSWNRGLYLVNVTNTAGAVETMKLVVK